ncbi:hypothetical protein HN51_050879 [Arachis hypogaea]
MIIVDQVNLKLEKPNTPTLSRNLFPKKPSPNLSRTIGQNFQLPGRRRAQSASDRFSPPPQLDAPTASWKIDATCVHGGVAKPLCRELYQEKESEDAIQKKDDATVSNNEV